MSTMYRMDRKQLGTVVLGLLLVLLLALAISYR